MDWKTMLGEGFGEKVLDALKQLAQGIGTVSEHVYEILVRQQVTVGIGYMIGGLIGLIIMAIILKIACKSASKEDWEDVEGHWIIIVFAVVISCAICIPFAVKGFMHIFNPEYYAIREIMDTIKGASK